MREAAEGTGWRDPDAAFERAVHAAVDAGYESTELCAFVEDIAAPGWSNSLTQKLVQLTMPGVPDVYQGSELWDDSLVDPDNRRPVDFTVRRALLASLSAPPPVDGSGSAKLWAVARTLDARREHPELFRRYAPLHAAGPAARHAIAFDRGGAISVATRQPVRLARDGGWRDTTLRLRAPHRDAFTGAAYTGDVPLAELLSALPVALLLSA
jgi:(1->4)-alpha-D-glucan 1-alpha-D-glucosylmutase